MKPVIKDTFRSRLDIWEKLRLGAFRENVKFPGSNYQYLSYLCTLYSTTGYPVARGGESNSFMLGGNPSQELNQFYYIQVYLFRLHPQGLIRVFFQKKLHILSSWIQTHCVYLYIKVDQTPNTLVQLRFMQMQFVQMNSGYPSSLLITRCPWH